jgi:hypothetical protein
MVPLAAQKDLLGKYPGHLGKWIGGRRTGVAFGKLANRIQVGGPV